MAPASQSLTAIKVCFLWTKDRTTLSVAVLVSENRVMGAASDRARDRDAVLVFVL
jgi:hypothetical protein